MQWSNAQNNSLDRATQILKSRGEVYFSFNLSPENLQQYSKILSIDNYNGKEVYAYANSKQFEAFLSTGNDFSIVEEYYNSEKALNMASSVAQMSNWDRYPTYEVYIEMMQKFALDFPDICLLDTIGYTTQGRLLLVVKISDNVNADEAEPEFLYSSTMHGDELFGGILYLRLIEYLLNGYGVDSEITNLVNGLQIYICPFANPDGTYYGGNNTVADSRRNNAQDIDLNRNFPDAIAGIHPDGEIYAVETQAFMDFAAQRNFVMGANSHGGAELVNYPYDTWATLPADNDWWYMVSREYGQLAQSNSPAGYFTDYPDGVTNGYAWYTITGSRQDYMNFFHNCREVTLELHAQKKLDSNALPAYWNYNRQATINYLMQATYGLNS